MISESEPRNKSFNIYYISLLWKENAELFTMFGMFCKIVSSL